MAQLKYVAVALGAVSVGQGTQMLRGDAFPPPGGGAFPQTIIRNSQGFEASEAKNTDFATRSLQVHGQVLTDVWKGRDLPIEQFNLDQMVGRANPADVAPSKNIQIFGLPNAGTTLLRLLLYVNFGRQINYFDSKVGPKERPNLKRGFDVMSNLLEMAKNYPDRFNSINGRKINVVSVVRNPYSWLQAMREDPELSSCGYALHGGCKQISLRGWGRANLTYPEMWNQYAEGFANANQAFGRHVLVNYESLVRTPENALNRIGAMLGLKAPPGGWIFPFDSKNSDERAGVLQRIDNHKYMEIFNDGEKTTVCKDLDTELQTALQYKTIDCAFNPVESYDDEEDDSIPLPDELAQPADGTVASSAEANATSADMAAIVAEDDELTRMTDELSEMAEDPAEAPVVDPEEPVQADEETPDVPGLELGE